MVQTSRMVSNLFMWPWTLSNCLQTVLEGLGVRLPAAFYSKSKSTPNPSRSLQSTSVLDLTCNKSGGLASDFIDDDPWLGYGPMLALWSSHNTLIDHRSLLDDVESKASELKTEIVSFRAARIDFQPLPENYESPESLCPLFATVWRRRRFRGY